VLVVRVISGAFNDSNLRLEACSGVQKLQFLFMEHNNYKYCYRLMLSQKHILITQRSTTQNLLEIELLKTEWNFERTAFDQSLKPLQGLYYFHVIFVF
jgi:hypothetical protein